jgi:excisionase family DNA binding protein
MNWSPEYPLLKTAEVASILGISKRTVCLWAECSELPALRIGKQWRFRRKAFFEWLERSEGLNYDSQAYEKPDRFGAARPQALRTVRQTGGHCLFAHRTPIRPLPKRLENLKSKGFN